MLFNRKPPCWWLPSAVYLGGREVISMQMIPVASSNLAAVGYADNTLWISFHSGGIYEYSNVPQSVYESLMNAPSKGKYFHAYIKRSYPYRRIG
nr:MAG TPA: KTSC domain [Caudoviricetes sp.]